MSESNKCPKFSSLQSHIDVRTLESIKTMGFKRMTEIQAAVLPRAFEGADIVASAKTGSGKTLAFLIPIIELTRKSIENGVAGTCGIIISPTRELAIQSYTVLEQLVAFLRTLTCALVIGGESRKKQAIELAKGAKILVATPGRLLDHMKSKEFVYKHLSCLVLDEADKMLQYGFEEDLKQIIKLLPKRRQTLLFRATQSDKTLALTTLAMKDDIEFINMSHDDDAATVEGLKHGYVICETENRLWWLLKMLKKAKKQKVMVFFSNCKSVEFHHAFFHSHCKASVICIHGKMNQIDRTTTMQEFYNAEKGTLFCTDVAARGLDIPAVNWIVQFDPPGDTSEYIHRVGRTARGVGGVGNAVLLLRPEEKDFLRYLRAAKVYVEQYQMWDNFECPQSMVESIVEDHSEMKKLAIEAYEGYIRAFEVRKLKDVFNLYALDLDALAKSFGLKEKPDIDIRLGFKKKHRPRKRMAKLLEEAALKKSPKL